MCQDLLARWGRLRRKSGAALQDGYIQRSGSPPILTDPERFLTWFGEQDPQLVHANSV